MAGRRTSLILLCYLAGAGRAAGRGAGRGATRGEERYVFRPERAQERFWDSWTHYRGKQGGAQQNTAVQHKPQYTRKAPHNQPEYRSNSGKQAALSLKQFVARYSTYLVQYKNEKIINFIPDLG